MLHGNFTFWSRAHVVKLGELLVQLSRTESQTPAVRALSPNYCIAREFPFFLLLNYINILIFKNVRYGQNVQQHQIRDRKVIHIKGKNPLASTHMKNHSTPLVTRKIQNKTTQCYLSHQIGQDVGLLNYLLLLRQVVYHFGGKIWKQLLKMFFPWPSTRLQAYPLRNFHLHPQSNFAQCPLQQ